MLLKKSRAQAGEILRARLQGATVTHRSASGKVRREHNIQLRSFNSCIKKCIATFLIKSGASKYFHTESNLGFKCISDDGLN